MAAAPATALPAGPRPLPAAPCPLPLRARRRLRRGAGLRRAGRGLPAVPGADLRRGAARR